MAGNSKPYVKVFDCPSCGGQVSIRASGYTLSVVCSSCGSIIDATNENYRILSTMAKKIPPKMTIPLGTRGKINGTLWEVVGFMQRRDSFAYDWQEYLLFNPYEGYRWLSEYEGHWNFITMTKVKPEISGSEALFKDRVYKAFSDYRARVLFVAGEFYWQVQSDDNCTMTEYIAPPFILSSEKNEDEIVWSLGESISHNEIEKAFKLKEIRSPKGISPNQVSPFADLKIYTSKMCFAFAIVLFIIQITYVAMTKPKIVYSQEIAVPTVSTEKVASSESFDMPSFMSAMDITIQSRINNDWIEVNGELINESKNDESFEFTHGVEYYSGYDSDGRWAEGTPNATITLSSIPKGKYHINFESVTNGEQAKNIAINQPTFQLIVESDVPIWYNFWFSILVLMAFPIYYAIRDYRFEMSRWEMSPYYEGN
ncbi:DUF4178 domain-containing protein [Bacteriovorax stolpii]|uniref:Uncharacterized protein n=1 Tax=Bacteriovorax stolpii TaxID=960 RepID=A0A2K9NMZ2_BACTC|nr:DUF4178 domain-containing protein [Bacteriovorax stolpii]AUN96901.1 hypothetical protein C0V70_02020 [Bacteriovorax stolpii]QDK43169.1 DUF4178 domain-containing protein [Bacteriovorax stolpii]TDP53180.1 uncharacterized protein DUF4178 [Bacteriovorax stolpii]